MNKLKLQKGQALITLLIFVIIAITITSAATAILIANTLSGVKAQEGLGAYYIAESGLENGILRTLRDPSYTGETVNIGNGSAVISVQGTNPKTITSTGTEGNFTRTLQVEVTYSNGYYTFSDWKEI